MGEPGHIADDAELVHQCLAGNREAFGEVVGRYQVLLCSLAFSFTGNLGHSEELAQETLVTAWKQLSTLREPSRLRPWLCGILRNLARNAFRAQPRDPVFSAQSLETIRDVPATELLPSEQTIGREEQALLWHSLKTIPELYREPLILFYREHQSIRQVAEDLDMTEEAVKQRLTRGRRLLQERVTSLMENALRRSRPGKAFTLGVLAALPLAGASSAAAATIAGAGVKAGGALKGVAVAGFGAAVLGPALGLLGSIFGSWASIKNTRSARERQFMIRMTYVCAAYVGLFLAAMFMLIFKGRSLAVSSPRTFGVLLGLLSGGYAAGLVTLILKANRRQRQIRQQDGTAEAPASHAVRPPTIQRLRWNVYGSLGGATSGMLAWLVIQSVQLGEWITAGLTVLFGVLQVIIAGRAWMKNPANRAAFMFRSLAASGLFLVAVGLYHWKQWTKSTGVQTTARQATGLGLALVAVSAAAMIWLAHRRASARQTCSAGKLLLMGTVPFLVFGINPPTIAASIPVSSWSLSNGVRVVCIPLRHTTNVSIFTFLPMGLATDGPGETQWSHLIEHLVIRSTMPGELSAANAETLPDHMRLDFYGDQSTWKEGLSYHGHWLSGVPFTGQNLAAERPKVQAEAQYTVKNLATHKFAMAAWAQGVRHGRTNAAVLGEVEKATLGEIQARRDEHLAVLSRTVVCIVGGIHPEQVRKETVNQLEKIKSSASPILPVKLQSARLEMTWDLEARHLVLSWPIPAPENKDFAALLVAGDWLNLQFYSDQALQKTTGMIIAGADLQTPEGSFFYISASLRAGGGFNEIQAQLLRYISKLESANRDDRFRLLAQQQAKAFASLPDPELLRPQLPPTTSMKILEANLGMQWGMAEYRFGSARKRLIENLSELAPNDISQAAIKYLTKSACICVSLQPAIR